MKELKQSVNIKLKEMGGKRSLDQTAVPQVDIYPVTTEFCIIEVYMALYGILHACLIISTRDKLCNSADKLLNRGKQASKTYQCRKHTRLKKSIITHG